MRQPATRSARPNFVVSVVAREGAGKTHFAFTAPKPLLAISVDPHTRAVLDKMVDDEEVSRDGITLHDLRLPAIAFSERQDVERDATESWDQIINALRPIADGRTPCATVVLDTATELWDINMFAEFGRKDQIKPETRKNMMGPVNARWGGMVRALQDAGSNVILLHRAKDRWVDSEERGTGGTKLVGRRLDGPFEMERIGYKNTGNICSAEVHLAFDPTREGRSLTRKYGLKVVRSTLRPALIGQEAWGVGADGVAAASFAALAVQLYPATSLSDWQ